MKVDKQTIPIYISVALSLITFCVIWVFGGIGLLIIYRILLPVILVLWILSFLLSISIKDLRGVISPSAITSAFIIYLGALFLSLSRFKTEIAQGSIDINMIGIGLALIAIALGLTTRYKEQKSEGEKSVRNSTSEAPQKNERTATNQELPSIDIVLDEVRRRLDFQFEQVDGLNIKSQIVLGVASVIFALLVTNLLGESNEVNNSILAKVALIPIFISIVLSFVPMYIRKFKRPPKLEKLRFHYIVKNSQETKLKIIDICRKAITVNEKLIKTIAGFINYSYVFLLIGLVLLAVWIFTIV